MTNGLKLTGTRPSAQNAKQQYLKFRLRTCDNVLHVRGAQQSGQ